MLLLWFRNDLRIHDNPALEYALAHGVKHAIFIATPQQWHKHHMAPIKVDLILRHVALLKAQLATLDIELQVVNAPDFNAQIDVISKTLESLGSNQVIVNQELELRERQRDQKLAALDITITAFESDVIVPKGLVRNNAGAMFKVFTPFKKAWLNYLLNNGFQYIPKRVITPVDYHALEPLLPKISRGDASKWPLAPDVESRVIPEFLQTKVSAYHDNRDIPSIKGTSGLSAYLNIGAISSRYLLALLLNTYPDLLHQQPPNVFSWLNELIWREFYRHLLMDFPELIKHKNFNDKYDELPWRNDPDHIKAWQEGKTGYPIVDAAMRQLNQTGWMHNRLRMIVASFLTKHLLVDWRIGEQYFMEKLIDGDFAANNGGWQWSAGTGCDAQPYFRIFNPISQSEKFDPQGAFIRNYLPELSDIPDKKIHFPHAYIAEQKLTTYWPAIVEHKQAREQALAFYKQYTR
ncbi:deoxyribodipyrimidine photo-lyase [Thalassotalea sp. LPB0316]|uniref:deoxyribodipyrimidine photo-lyase n=1 Tax=Thalassotalea sp. LPB0316 TaxID=2769490 RepID=UPI001868F485|nr:deoxyribodipyrimidine photo-lyase [Thalassotalea sp. LPB0316]QOL27262.1 deoxyribodipyrimidine photo-lyase [Thalassotalea sp. LPB0316]